jgi:hypothetical protein
MSARSASVSGSKLFPSVAVEQLDVLGCLLPVPRRPVDVGAEPERLAAFEAGDHLEREIVAADVGQRAGLDHQPRHANFVAEAVRVARSTACALSGLWFIR